MCMHICVFVLICLFLGLKDRIYFLNTLRHMHFKAHPYSTWCFLWFSNKVDYYIRRANSIRVKYNSLQALAALIFSKMHCVPEVTGSLWDKIPLPSRQLYKQGWELITSSAGLPPNILSSIFLIAALSWQAILSCYHRHRV